MVTRPPPIDRSGQVNRFRTMGEGERIKTHSLMIAWKWCLGRRKSAGNLNNTWYISSTVGLKIPVIPVFSRYGRYGTTETEYSDRWHRRRVVLTEATWRTTHTAYRTYCELSGRYTHIRCTYSTCRYARSAYSCRAACRAFTRQLLQNRVSTKISDAHTAHVVTTDLHIHPRTIAATCRGMSHREIIQISTS